MRSAPREGQHRHRPSGVSRLFRALLIAFTLSLPAVALAIADEGGVPGAAGTPAVLSDPDRESLVASACAGQGAHAPPVAWREAGAGRRLRSGLDCLTERRFEGREVVRHFECERLAPRQWRCDPGADMLVLELPSRSVLIGPGEPTELARTVLQIADLLGSHATTFNGRDLNAMMRGRCDVRRLGPAAFQGGVDYLMSCGGRGVVVTKDCGARPCRLFPSELRDQASAPGTARAPDAAR